ncbi:MAG: phosphomethylpyrimidine synthase ThiC [Desulfobacteraceae bacterium]
MTDYTTQMDAASRGIVTPQMKEILDTEPISETDLLNGIAEGRIAVPANIHHKHLAAKGIGAGLKTKVNVNLGISEDKGSFESEMHKAQLAAVHKADALMDLSVSGNTRRFRRSLVEHSPLVIGTVPIYDTLTRTGKQVRDITLDDWFETVEMHAKDGVDFVTIHAGLTSACVDTLKTDSRLAGIVSRGGSILAEWMVKNGRENPFFEYFDRLLDICLEYDVCISLGDGLRPGALKDSSDSAQFHELIMLGRLTKAAWARKVQVIIEGPGHIRLNEIEMNIRLQKKLCHNAPFYVLGPIVTDIAPGYDHITSAIGGAVAAMHGADFLCYVTPAEHLRLPEADDVKEGIMASRIAAHAADIAKGLQGAEEIDHEMGRHRKNLDWEGQFSCAMDPEKARAYRESSMPREKDACTMCGDFCAVKRAAGVFDKATS